MARNTKRKLAIFAGTSKCLIYAEAKYCASEMPGEIKYYECSKAEYCCAFGCCVSPGFHFPHLWYYWILVIIMFLVCSGGGWWYRYWLQGRYRAAASAIPSRSSTSRAQNALRGQGCQAQRARITYNSARNTVLLHRMWKGPQRNGAAPAYNGTATTSGHYQNMSVVLNDANCPYYQLYGPPPSYETVIAQSRGKPSNPASPESSRMNLPPSANVIPNPTPQCFSYPCQPSPRLNNRLDQPVPGGQYQNGTTSPRQLDEQVPFNHFQQYCPTNVRRNVCVPYEYQEQPVLEESFARPCQPNGSVAAAGYVAYPDKSSDTSDPESQGYEAAQPKRYTMISSEDRAGSSGEPSHWEAIHESRSISRIHRNRLSDKNHGPATTPEKVPMFSSEAEEVPGEESDSRELEDEPGRRVYPGSLSYSDKIGPEDYSVQRVLLRSSPRSCEAGVPAVNEGVERASPSRETANASTSPLQSNPSSNVILDSFVPGEQATCTNTENGECRPRLINGSTNSDLESKHRLDRSKSLD